MTEQWVCMPVRVRAIEYHGISEGEDLSRCFSLIEFFTTLFSAILYESTSDDTRCQDSRVPGSRSQAAFPQQCGFRLGSSLRKIEVGILDVLDLPPVGSVLKDTFTNIETGRRAREILMAEFSHLPVDEADVNRSSYNVKE